VGHNSYHSKASPPGSAGAGAGSHDSYIEPLQPVALHSPLSPARDYSEGPPQLPELELDDMMESPSLSDGLPLRSPDRADWRDDRYGSQQPTPTTWEHRLEGDGMPDGIISEWDTEGVASWMNSLGFGKYHDALLG
jgi:hypothetical protein